MTIVLGMIGHNCSLIAADSRMMKSVFLDNGVPQNKIEVESDSFKKTFQASDNKIIGGVSGLMRFSQKTTSDHMAEIFNHVLPSHLSVEEYLDDACKLFKTRLLEIDEKEVTFQRRSVSFILSTFLSDDLKNFALYKISFNPTANTINYSIDKKPKKKLDKKGWEWEIIGDPDAFIATQHFCNSRYYESHQKDYGNMLSVATRAIKKGVSNSSFYYGSEYRCCGGETTIVQIR